ncbi:MAG: response regulator [Deltaproteobacteria bacterium]|nr:response regulator [Deltaproteobacteria bacterium]
MVDKTSNEQQFAEDFNIEQILAHKAFRILIADDDPDARALLEIALANPRYELKLFSNGQEALAGWNDFLPDLTLLDWQMPLLSGIEVCAQIKARSGKNFCPVILLTSLAEVSDRVSGLNCGADEYITKPFAMPELEARVHAILRIKVLTDELRRTQNLLQVKEKQIIAMQVAGAACHELGQPLTTIMLNYQLLLQLNSADPKFQQTLSAVIEQCQRMVAILKRLTEVSDYKTKAYANGIEIMDIGLS